MKEGSVLFYLPTEGQPCPKDGDVARDPISQIAPLARRDGAGEGLRSLWPMPLRLGTMRASPSIPNAP